MYTFEDELNIDAGKHVLAFFLNYELFWMNNKQLLNSAFASYEALWRSRKVLSASRP